MDCKRILFISPSLGSGGAERQIVTVASLLKDAGYDVEFLCYLPGDFYAYILKDKQIPIHWNIFPGVLKRMMYVRKFIRSGNYDAVISFLETPNFLNNFSAIGGKKWKVITGERSANEGTFLSKRGKIFCWFQRFSDYIVCNSENAKQRWLRYYPHYETKLRTIYNTVHLQPITTEYKPRLEGKIHVIVAASYQYLKNTIGLVHALALLDEADRKKINVDWYGRKEVIKGDTRAFDECMLAIKNYNLQDVISLHGDITSIHDKMNEADVVALFSKYEGLPNAICEGMFLAKPIIMTRVSDYRILIDNTNGFLCDWDDTESIKNVLIQIINLKQDDLLQMGQSSKQKACNLFDHDSILKKWINLI